MSVRFALDGEIITYDCTDPTETVLEMLRYRLRRTGTKEGCAEGDCGACTVLLGEMADDEAGDSNGRVRWRSINACIAFVPMIDGRALMTVESLAKDGVLHPVQQSMVDCHASQCGFCTPGFVMSLYGRAIGACGTSDASVCDVVSGNLCRCTGYGPIIEAGEDNPPARVDDGPTLALLRDIARNEPLLIEGKDAVTQTPRRWFAPHTTQQMADALQDRPEAQVLAGATDVGLWVTKQLRELGDIVWLGKVAELRAISEDDGGLTLGAGVSYTHAHQALARLHPDLGALVQRIAGMQVRNSGTIGGNIANGSPIGDMPPALIAMGAQLTLRKGAERRVLPLEEYFLTYGKQDRAPGEFVEHVHIPRPDADALVRIVKLSKRFTSDISAVLAAFHLTFDGDTANRTVTGARIAFGGMAGTPQRALATEAALIGQQWSKATIERAAAALAQDYAPLNDLRGSSQYRLEVAANLLRKLWLESGEAADAPLSLQDLALQDLALHDLALHDLGTDHG